MTLLKSWPKFTSRTEIIETLRPLVAAEWPYTRIAKELGTTKGAVAGMLGRWFPDRKKRPWRPMRKIAAVAASEALQRKKAKPVRDKPKRVLPSVQASVAPPEPIAASPILWTSRRFGRQCAYIADDPKGKSDLTCCGANTVLGRHWCAEHLAVCFRAKVARGVAA